jgi:hypothetical protein
MLPKEPLVILSNFGDFTSGNLLDTWKDRSFPSFFSPKD